MQSRVAAPLLKAFLAKLLGNRLLPNETEKERQP